MERESQSLDLERRVTLSSAGGVIQYVWGAPMESAPLKRGETEARSV